ncbi:MAG: phospholipase D family protein [Gammaproteobacteria bacterium]|nr:phospholipase D family protein [Gammaproteobacteria bacterium]NNJ50169.1 phospholipase D family protein [Gammaproteobacteria bacterium]
MDTSNKKSGFYLLSDNTDAFVARFALATIAEKTLDIQYYIIHSDASGRYLAYAILSAADRGVRVRILVDDINMSGHDGNFKMFSQHENIEIRIFNPLSNRDWFRNIELLINLNRAGRRMHNKTFIADNASAIIGGRNIGDEYFDDRNNLNFLDLDLLTVGPIVDDVSNSFDDYWHSQWATPIEQLSKTRVMRKQLMTLRSNLKDRWHRLKNTDYFQSLKNASFTQKIINRRIDFIWAEADLFYDRPEKISSDDPDKTVHIGPQIMPYFEHAEKELLIATPYFVPGKKGTRWLKEKRDQGIEISILTNSLAATDVSAVHAGYRKYRKQLLATGIDLYELKATARPGQSKTRKLIEGSRHASLHAKYMVVDRQYVLIGSANIDPRSQLLNTEIGIMVNSPQLAKQTIELFARSSSLENSYHLRLDDSSNRLNWLTEESSGSTLYTTEPGAGLLRKLAVEMMSLLPIESLL